MRLRAGDVAGLASRLDWALKLHILERAIASRPGLGWSDPRRQASRPALRERGRGNGPLLGLRGGRCGGTAGLRTPTSSACDASRPTTARAWGRAMLLRLGGRHVHDVDWDRVVFRESRRGYWPILRTIALDDPLGFTRAGRRPGDRRGRRPRTTYSTRSAPARRPSMARRRWALVSTGVADGRRRRTRKETRRWARLNAATRIPTRRPPARPCVTPRAVREALERVATAGEERHRARSLPRLAALPFGGAPGGGQ